MSPGEIAWRIKQQCWKRSARKSRKRKQREFKEAALRQPSIAKMLDGINFYGLGTCKPSDVPSIWRENTIHVADELLAHKYNYLSIGQIDLGDTIKWNHEYKRNIDTPLVFGPKMNYRDFSSYGDFKYLWELPRFQHLITLAKAFYLTKQQQYADEVKIQVKEFIEQSPYLLGVNWAVPMEPAIRLISLSWISCFLKEYLKEDKELNRYIAEMIMSHSAYVVENYASYSSANNHLVGEAAGIFVAGVCFGDIENMKVYCEEAQRILAREIALQHYEDGVNKEQAVHYQLFALEFFVICGILAKTNNMNFAGEYWSVLEKSIEFMAAVTDEKCHLVHLGDSDDGRAVVLSETDCNDVRSILAIGAVLFERGDFKAKAEYFTESAFWYLGHEGKHTFDSLPAKEFLATRQFSQGGYYFLTNKQKRGVKVIFDCGPLGFGSIAAHGHADCLSFTLTADGRDYFVDPGTYIYIADDPYRNYFRSTRAHNTIRIDQRDQSEMAGPFLWKHKAQAHPESYHSDQIHDCVEGWHDGYHILSDPVTHHRKIDLQKENELVIITDRLEMNRSHRIEQYFHLSPNCTIELLESNRWKITNERKNIELLLDDRFEGNVYHGQESPICGWYSDVYDVKVPTHTIIASGDFTGNQTFITKICLRMNTEVLLERNTAEYSKT